MKCNCKAELEEKIVKNMDYHGKKILKAELDAMITFSPMSLYTSSAVTITVEGRKSKVDMPVKHTYCPWCGIKADDEVEEKATENVHPVTG